MNLAWWLSSLVGIAKNYRVEVSQTEWGVAGRFGK
jgi:hypothetical protein